MLILREQVSTRDAAALHEKRLRMACTSENARTPKDEDATKARSNQPLVQSKDQEQKERKEKEWSGAEREILGKLPNISLLSLLSAELKASL